MAPSPCKRSPRFPHTIIDGRECGYKTYEYIIIDIYDAEGVTVVPPKIVNYKRISMVRALFYVSF